MLKNKAGFWTSVQWTFKTRDDDDFIYIENIRNTRKVLGATKNGEVIEEFFVENQPNQLWKRGKADAQHYFTLRNKLKFKAPMVLTAITKSSLEIKGNITLR